MEFKLIAPCVIGCIAVLVMHCAIPNDLSAQSLSANTRKICDLPATISESSGLVMAGPDKIWTHSDSGDPNFLFLVDTTGILLRTLVIQNASNIDWEDIARDNEGNIWINDAGNNGQGRRDLRLYRINNPDLHQADTVQAIRLAFSFEDQIAFPPPASEHNFDIEAMSWYNDSLYLFTKDRSVPFTGYTKMYVLPADSGNYVARLVDSFFVDGDAQRGRVTAADIDTATGTLALLTRSQLLCFYNYPAALFFQGQLNRYFFSARVDQVEAIAFLNGNTLFMTDEGSPSNNVRGALYEVSLSQVVHVEPIAAKNKLKLHLSHNKQFIQLFGDLPIPAIVRVISSEGKCVVTSTLGEEGRLNLPPLQPGLYFLEVQQAGLPHWIKFIY
ncbi:MAG: hypothetical protein ACK417_05120 [Bacteroidia bacterium]